MPTGLDPLPRRDTWQLIEHVRDCGVTVIPVNHYMDEAERLGDRVALLDRGRIVAIDTPEGLADQAGVAKRVQFEPSKPFDDHLLTTLPGVRSVEHEGKHVIVTGSGDVANDVILTLAAAGITATDLHLDSANLEDAFVQMTGRHIHDNEVGRAAHLNPRSASPKRRAELASMTCISGRVSARAVTVGRPHAATISKLRSRSCLWGQLLGLVTVHARTTGVMGDVVRRLVTDVDATAQAGQRLSLMLAGLAGIGARRRRSREC